MIILLTAFALRTYDAPTSWWVVFWLIFLLEVLTQLGKK